MDFQDYLKDWFGDETEEVGLYMAMARQAEREGYPEIARQFRENALAEAEHAGIAAELAGMVGKTKENLEKMIGGEDSANSERVKWAEKRSGEEEAYLRTTAMDEARHKRALKGLRESL
ncbi:MAG: ferritin family protein [Candidatus Aenigmatarchaeota archaeon]